MTVAAGRPVGEELRSGEGARAGGCERGTQFSRAISNHQKTQCANAQRNCPAPHLAAWMTAPSRTLEKEPILIVFRSPRRTAPCQTDTCYDRKRASTLGHAHELAIGQLACCMHNHLNSQLHFVALPSPFPPSSPGRRGRHRRSARRWGPPRHRGQASGRAGRGGPTGVACRDRQVDTDDAASSTREPLKRTTPLSPANPPVVHLFFNVHRGTSAGTGAQSAQGNGRGARAPGSNEA